jgi:hypothetical protein
VATRASTNSISVDARLAGFTELVGTALANAEAQAALTAAAATIVHAPTLAAAGSPGELGATGFAESDLT